MKELFFESKPFLVIHFFNCDSRSRVLILLLSIIFFLPIAVNAQTEFITTWKTDNPGLTNSTSILIPVDSLLTTYNYDVDWDNDGSFDELSISGAVIHDFGAPGIYTIRIRGDFPALRFEDEGDKDKILDVSQWGNIQWESFFRAFLGCSNLNFSATDAPDLSNVTSLSSAFGKCSSLNSNINHWDVSNITDMDGTFQQCVLFNQPLNNWDVGNVETMRFTFSNARAFNQNIGSWDVRRVKNMSTLFSAAESFNQDISNWEVDSLTTVDFMFRRALAFNQPLGSWQFPQLTSLRGMFSAAISFNQNLSTWDVSNVTNFSYLFDQAKSFSQDISGWDVSNGTDFSYMFNGAQAFNAPIINWQVDKAQNMAYMFRGAFVFNQDISSWNVSGVRFMHYMFSQTRTFNQNIGLWDVSQVSNMSQMFSNTNVFNIDISLWNTSNVTNMSYMFLRALVFNQDIGDWDVSKVTSMQNMFEGATNFNQDLSQWDVNQVTSMSSMFRDSPIDQDFGDWNVSNVTDMDKMFLNAPLSTANYDSLLIGWDKLILQPDVEFNANKSIYCAGGPARANIISTYNWTITDSGAENVAPTPVCQDITVILDATGNATLSAEMLDNGSFDLCTSVNFSSSKTSFDCSDIGTLLITLTVTDANGNSATCDANVTVREPTPIITCPTDISIAPIVSGCMASVTWTEPIPICGVTITSTHNSGDLFSPGTTTVTYTASNAFGIVNCSFDVAVVNDLSVSADSTVKTSCFDSFDGQAFVTVSGGNSPYTYDWDFDGKGDFDDLKDQTGLPISINNLIVRDAGGCEASTSVDINPEPLAFTNCPSDISILTNFSDCRASVTWLGPDLLCTNATVTSSHNSGDIFDIGTTSVTYTASNTLGETVMCTFDVIVYNDLTVIVNSQTDASCSAASDGQAFISVSGGVAPYSFDWDYDGKGDFDDEEDQNDIPSGLNHFVVRDATGCTVNDSVTIGALSLTLLNCPSDITISSNTSECSAVVTWQPPLSSCEEVSITSTHQPGDVFGIGTTTVTYTTNNTEGEVVQCDIKVTVINDLKVVVDSLSGPSCFNEQNGQAFITLEGGTTPYSYDWDYDETNDFDDREDQDGLSAGTYALQVLDASGCRATAEVTLTQPSSIELVAKMDESIFGGAKKIDLSVNGGTLPYSFDWTNDTMLDFDDTEDTEVSKPGAYTVFVRDGNSCTDSLTVTIDPVEFNCHDIDFDVYPNPSYGEFTVQFNSCTDAVLIEIYDGVGKKVLTLQTSEIVNKISLPDVSHSTYIVRARRGNRVINKVLLMAGVAR